MYIKKRNDLRIFIEAYRRGGHVSTLVSNFQQRKFVFTVGLSLVTAFIDLRGKPTRCQTRTEKTKLGRLKRHRMSQT